MSIPHFRILFDRFGQTIINDKKQTFTSIDALHHFRPDRLYEFQHPIGRRIF